FLFEKECTVTYRDLISSVDALTAFIRNTYGGGRKMLLMAENSHFFIVSYLAEKKENDSLFWR
ncbi:MAG: hypothetical protein LUP99_02660, partial [Methanomicrobiales archaeon]|nr:hypothetical protein [Methanomicrobiales archaeon]